MKWQLPAALVAVLLIAWAGAFWAADRPSILSGPSNRPRQYEKHYVTPKQLTAAGAMSAHTVGPLAAVPHDGQPVVVVFIKHDCPCNVEFEPFFHRLHRAYRGSTRFVGVIDGPVEMARHYARDNRVPYLVLADPRREIISRFHAKNGAYVALLTPAGTLDTLWPGVSVEMMRELGRRIAELAGTTEQVLDATGLPGVLTTGCPFTD
jgi:hypothetical protein